MKKTMGLATAMALLLGAANANATTISLNPSAPTVNLGDAFTVQVFTFGLGVTAAPSIGVFDLNLSFDPTLLSYRSAVFGDPVLGDQLNLFAGFSDTLAVTNGSGIVNLFELSYDFPSDLDAFQADAFTMATVTFDTLATGTSNLVLSLNTLGDANGDPLPATLENGRVTVNAPNEAPEPVTFGLVALGLIGLVLRRGSLPLRSVAG